MDDSSDSDDQGPICPPKKKARRSSGDEEKETFDLKVTEHASIVVIAEDPTNIKGSTKIAAFDMDSTLIVPNGKHKFSRNRTDWTWFSSKVPGKLQQLYGAEGFQVVLFSNQNGISKGKVSQSDVTGKIQDLAQELKIPLVAFLSKEADRWRKPNVAMWEHFEANYNGGTAIDYSSSFYVGDAAGRPKGWRTKKTPKDFSVSDRKFAHNVGVRFHTPEAFFLGEREHSSWEWRGLNPSEWLERKENDPQRIKEERQWFHGSLPIANQKPLELVVMRGPPGSGKTAFTKRFLVDSGYRWVNQDELRSKAKCKKALEAALKLKQSVVIDRTFPDRASRREFIELGQKYNAHIRLFSMTTPREVAEHCNMVRVRKAEAKKVSAVVYHTFYKKQREDGPPSLDEGFAEIVDVDFVPQFKDESERKLWTQFTSF